MNTRSGRNFLRWLVILAIAAILIFAVVFGPELYHQIWQNSSVADQNLDTGDFYHPPLPSSSSSPTPSTIQSLPANAIMTIQFTSQAPFAVWDQFHEDSCEEASFLIVYHYLKQTSLGTPADVDAELHDMVNFENAAGFGPSISVSELNQIAKEKYGLSGQVKSASVSNIEADVAAGWPVIVPAAGKILPNPNFRNGGPNYHMLVIKGYDENDFITNDPGTRLGNGFVYKKSALLNAIHDWDPNNILNGKKLYLVF